MSSQSTSAPNGEENKPDENEDSEEMKRVRLMVSQHSSSPIKRVRFLSFHSPSSYFIVMAHKRCTKGPLFYTFLTLKESGELYGHGDNTNGIIGLAHDRFVPLPRRSSICNVIKVVHTKTSVIVLTKEKRAYSWGDNYCGQLGYGHMREENFIPKRILFPTCTDSTNVEEEHLIQDISCGAWHGMALTTKGLVFTWGGNLVGQLGNGRTSNNNIDQCKPLVIPFRVPISESVVIIESGVYHCVAIDYLGKAWGWGTNLYGQLPVTNFDEFETITHPTLLYPSGIEPIRAAACGTFNTLLLTEAGDVYYYGDRHHTSPNFTLLPFKLRNPVQEVYTNYGLVFVKDTEQKFYVWGEIRGHKKTINFPQSVSRQVKSIDHVLLLFSRHECTQNMVKVETQQNILNSGTTQVLDFNLRHKIFTTLMPVDSNKWM